MTLSRGVRPRRRPGDPVAGGRFRVGQPVQFSAEALAALPMRSTKIKTGVVVGASHDGRYVRVRRDTVKEVEAYHPDFWTARGSL